MVKFVDECVCPPEIIRYCTRQTCQYKNVPVLTCDRCRDEVDKLYYFDRAELCEDCIKELDPELEPDELEEVGIYS